MKILSKFGWIVIGIFLSFFLQGTIGPPFMRWVSEMYSGTEAARSYETARTEYLKFTRQGFSMAKKHYEHALDVAPNLTKAHAGLGELYAMWAILDEKRGRDRGPNLIRSVRYATLAIMRDSGLLEAQRAMAASLLAIELHEKAKPATGERIGRALAIAPFDGESQYIEWVAKGEDINDTYVQTIESNAKFDHLMALVHVGLVLGQAGEWDRSADLLNRALRVERDHPFANFGLGTVKFNTGKLEDAERLLKRAVVADNDNYRFRYNLAKVLYSLGKNEDAIQHLRKATDIKPSFVWGWTNLGYAQFELGDTHSAHQSWEKARSIVKGEVGFALAGIALLQLERGEIREACDTFKAAMGAASKEGLDMRGPKHQKELGKKAKRVLQDLIDRCKI